MHRRRTLPPYPDYRSMQLKHVIKLVVEADAPPLAAETYDVASSREASKPKKVRLGSSKRSKSVSFLNNPLANSPSHLFLQPGIKSEVKTKVGTLKGSEYGPPCGRCGKKGSTTATTTE